MGMWGPGRVEMSPFHRYFPCMELLSLVLILQQTIASLPHGFPANQGKTGLEPHRHHPRGSPELQNPLFPSLQFLVLAKGRQSKASALQELHRYKIRCI